MNLTKKFDSNAHWPLHKFQISDKSLKNAKYICLAYIALANTDSQKNFTMPKVVPRPNSSLARFLNTKIGLKAWPGDRRPGRELGYFTLPWGRGLIRFADERGSELRWRLPLRANSLSTSFADCALTRYMHIATGKVEYERELRPRAENATYLQNYARLVNSDFTNTFYVALHACFAATDGNHLPRLVLCYSTSREPGESRIRSICIRNSQTQNKSLSICGRNLPYTRIVHDALQLFTYSLLVDILHFLCSCRKRS